MADRWEDEDHYGDCMDEEIDALEGTAHCWRCGNRRVLGSDELRQRLEFEAQAQSDWDAHCAKLEAEGLAVEPPVEAADLQNDEIPF